MKVYRVMRGRPYQDIWFTSEELAKEFKEKVLDQIEAGDEQIDSFEVYESLPEMSFYFLLNGMIDENGFDYNHRVTLVERELNPMEHSDLQISFVNYSHGKSAYVHIHIGGGDREACEAELERLRVKGEQALKAIQGD